jgi:catechol 2,3-dioxygenase-like lactoylglutathione lyase family enzyme
VKYIDALLKIDNIMFFVMDLEKAAEYYENVLGSKRVWTEKIGNDRFRFYKRQF